MANTRGAAALLLSGALCLTCGPALAQSSQTPEANPSSSAASPASAAPAPPAASAAPGVTVPNFATQAWVLADLDSGEILAQLNPHLKLRPASTQKLLTALTVAPRLNPDQLYRADKGDETADGNRVVLYRGLTYKVSDLLHAALLPSANDAAIALAKANGGVEATVAQMNAEAARIGATDTTVVNPSGLDADGQFSSAHDMAAIGRAAFLNPEIAAYMKLASVDFPGKALANGSRVIYPIYSLNTTLRSHFKGSLGGKSGYTTLARRTMVAAAERDGHRLIVSLMNIGGNTYRTAEQVLNWGFANYGQLQPVDSLPQPSAPAPTFAREIVPLSETSGGPPTTAEPKRAKKDAAETADYAAAPPAPAGHGTGSGIGLSGLLTLMTLLAGALAVARARVFYKLSSAQATPRGRSRSRPGGVQREVRRQRDPDLVDA
jgi:D-alanyl-D-alanine carboxypeptidase (penicillin-binding protein 5/6)